MDIYPFIKLEMVSKEEGSVFFLRNTLSYKIKPDLNMNVYAIKCLCLEISNKKCKNIIFILNYRPPNGDTTLFERHVKSILSKNNVAKKEVILIGNFNINLLEFDKNKRVQSFLNLMFPVGMIPTKNKCQKAHCYCN